MRKPYIRWACISVLMAFAIGVGMMGAAWATASYPTSVKSFTTKVDNVDDVMADDINSLQDEVVAIETALGVNFTPGPGYPDHANKGTEKIDNTAYQATEDGWLVGWAAAGSQAQVHILLGTTSGGADLQDILISGSTGTINTYGGFCIPIKSGTYYKMTPCANPGNTDYYSLYFVPNL